MAKICGLQIKHVPGFSYENNIMLHDFFADTPCYRPSFVEKMCQNENFDANFIYIEKDHREIFDSWNKVGLFKNYNWMYNQYIDPELKSKMRYSMIYDIESYQEALSDTLMDENNFSELITRHKETMTQIIKKYNKNILFYDFSQGWESFCNFLGCEVKSEELPYINKDTMFEKID